MLNRVAPANVDWIYHVFITVTALEGACVSIIPLDVAGGRTILRDKSGFACCGAYYRLLKHI